MKYSIIIPTFNKCDELLKPCVESIIKYTDLSDLEVIIVANGCTDNTREFLQSLSAPFKFLWFDSALGYTKAANAGIKVASGEFVILLNNDTEVLPSEKSQWINQLIEPFYKNPKLAISGPLALHDMDVDHKFIVFYCAMIKREMFDILGLLDEVFSPGYGEDIDFAMRALAAGYEIKEICENKFENGTNVGNFPMWHKGTQTFKDIDEYGSVIVKRNQAILRERYRKKLLKNTEGTTNMKYSIVIPTYNHCDDLLKPCLESIFKHTNMNEVELIISANGCTDNTRSYLDELKNKFNSVGFQDNLKISWSDSALGFPAAVNSGIKLSTADKIVLLNNDCVLLEQATNQWLTVLNNEFEKNSKCGISCVVKAFSEPVQKEVAAFFCVMIERKVFEKIGLLNEDYGVGCGENVEFCMEAERAGFEISVADNVVWDDRLKRHVGGYPIYHRSEATVGDKNLVQNIEEIKLRNSLQVSRKYHLDWYRWKLSNNYERAVFLRGDSIFPNFNREHVRYQWARENLYGKKILEIGCSTGFGTQYLPSDVDYLGLDYDEIIIDCARDQNWGSNFKFSYADINKFPLEYYDTIIAFEVIEHLRNGLELVEKLKKHCKVLLITVPRKEPVGFWGPHHVLHNLDESMFPGFEFKYIDEDGTLMDQPNNNIINLMVCKHVNQ